MAFEKLPVDPQVDALVRLLVIAEMRVQQALQEALAGGSVGTARYRRQRLMALRTDLQKILKQVEGSAPSMVQDSFKAGLYVAGGRKLMASFGGGSSQPALDALTKNMLSSIEGGVMTIGRNVDDVYRRVGLRQTALHLLEHSTREDASKKMQEQLMRQGLTSFVDKANRHWKLSTYSSMVIRTTTREAVTAGTTQGMVDTGRDLVEIFEHNDSCDICSPYRGQTYSLTGRVPGYPVMIKHPPFHPRCRCVMGPAKANFLALEAELGLTPSVDLLGSSEAA